MGISGNALAFIGGAAEQFAENKQGFKKELRENKRKQKEWLNTYGNKALDETKQQQESVELALDELEARGLKTPDALQLLQRHGVNAVLELNKTVKDYESANSTTVDADLMNKIWKAAEDFTPTSQSFEEAVSKVFGTNKAGSTAPVIQESEERGFFDKIKANLSGAYEDEEYDDFLSDPSEGMGGYTINELRAMSASSLSMVGSDGAAVFDRSVLRGDEPSAGEVRLWKNTTNIIVREALKNLSPADRQAVGKRENSNLDFVDRDADDIFFDLADPDGVYFEAFSEATRKVHEQNPFSNNRAATGAYGGQDALDSILNSESAATIAQREKEEQLQEDLEAANYTETNKPSELTSVDEVQEYFDNNPDANHVILNDELISRDSDEGATLPPPTEGIPTRPVPRYTGGEKTRPLQKPINNRDIKDWDGQYGGKYNPDATPIIVEPRETMPETFDETKFDTPAKIRTERGRITNGIANWNRQYKKTHDPVTGKPLSSGSQ
tara:strand:- start:40 stop:1533 length:1494 start_codon:yes stop_codon:yes gene_type:complete